MNEVEETVMAARQALQQSDVTSAERILAPLFRRGLANHPGVLLLAGLIRLQQGRIPEAEKIFTQGRVLAPGDAMLAYYHGGALGSLRRAEDAAQAYRAAIVLKPDLTEARLALSALLIETGEMEEAERITRGGLHLDMDPALRGVLHNNLALTLRAQRLDEEALQSYDRAPRTRDLMLDKASFLIQIQRAEEAHALYRDVLAVDANDIVAAVGAASALMMLERYSDASSAFDSALARHADPDLLASASQAALLLQDPQKALDLCEKALALDRHHQGAIANSSVSLRLMGDERELELNQYDSLVQVFDLEPPEGFSSVEDFNAELCAALDRLHPGMHENLNQTLRGGTQTQGHLFGSGQFLVDKIQARINDAIARYLGALKPDETHPFLSRRGRDFRYAGSWSSRLMDCGFHVNHIHPNGWISSCYYVGVPDAVKDEKEKQGWIKFGESGFTQLGDKNPPPPAMDGTSSHAPVPR